MGTFLRYLNPTRETMKHNGELLTTYNERQSALAEAIEVVN